MHIDKSNQYIQRYLEPIFVEMLILLIEIRANYLCEQFDK